MSAHLWKLRGLLVGVACLLLGACDEETDRATDIDTLRVLAVGAETPYAKPGTNVRVDMLVYDGSPKAVQSDGTRRKLSLLWLGGCTNPPGDDYRACLPFVYEVLDQLGGEALASQTLPPGAPPGFVGWGETFTAVVPADTVSSRPVAEGVIHPYGVQFIFFAACAGELRRLAPSTDSSMVLPLGCYRAGTSEALGREDFEFGFFPLFVYNDVENHNPTIDSVALNGIVAGEACSSESPCPQGQHCGSAQTCLPIVPRCGESDVDDCPKLDFALRVPGSIVEQAVLARVQAEQAAAETIWVNYYANHGSFEKGARTIHDANSGWTDSYGGKYRAWAPSGTESRLWAVLHDDRNGVSWTWQDIWIE